jgi:hypothetical protein
MTNNNFDITDRRDAANKASESLKNRGNNHGLLILWMLETDKYQYRKSASMLTCDHQHFPSF